VLVLSRGPEEAIVIGDAVEVRVLEVRGDRVRLGIIAPSEIPVHRKEVFLAIQKENREASAAEAAGLTGALDLMGSSAATVAAGKVPAAAGDGGNRGAGPGGAARSPGAVREGRETRGTFG
jgi:carbon storage regulator